MQANHPALSSVLSSLPSCATTNVPFNTVIDSLDECQCLGTCRFPGPRITRYVALVVGFVYRIDISKPPSSGSHFMSSGLTAFPIGSAPVCAYVPTGHSMALSISAPSKLHFMTASLLSSWARDDW